MSDRFLDRLPLFQGVSQDKREKAYASFARQRFLRNSLIFQQGDPARKAFVLRSGLVKLVTFSLRERPVTLELIFPGQIFGVLALLDSRPYPVSGMALEDSDIDSIPGYVFESLFKNSAEFARAVHNEVGRHMRHAHIMRSLSQEPVEKRLAHVLLMLMPEKGRETRLRREDISEMAGCIPETAIRVLSEMKKRGILQTGWKRIVLRDAVALRELAGLPPSGKPVFAHI